MRIPLMLSKVQYEQAKVSIFGYEMMNGIDREHRQGRKPVAQRPAISQKIFMGARKPVASLTVEEEPEQLTTRSEYHLSSSPASPSMAIGVAT